jgi:hypothetical protein
MIFECYFVIYVLNFLSFFIGKKVNEDVCGDGCLKYLT